MPIFHSRRFGGDPRVRSDQRRVHFHISEDFLQHLPVHKAGPQDDRASLGQVDDGGFKADPHFAAVNDHLHSAVQIFHAIFCHRRTGPSGPVGAGRRDKAAGGIDQRLRDPVAREADRHRVESPCCLLRDQVALFEDHGQRARPESLRKLLRLRRDLAHDQLYILESADMHDQRVVGRPSLGRVDLPG